MIGDFSILVLLFLFLLFELGKSIHEKVEKQNIILKVIFQHFRDASVSA